MNIKNKYYKITDCMTFEERAELKLLFDELLNIEDKVRKDWGDNKKCECVDKVLPGHFLNCNHLKKEIKKQTKETKTKFRILFRKEMDSLKKEFDETFRKQNFWEWDL